MSFEVRKTLSEESFAAGSHSTEWLSNEIASKLSGKILSGGLSHQAAEGHRERWFICFYATLMVRGLEVAGTRWREDAVGKGSCETTAPRFMVQQGQFSHAVWDMGPKGAQSKTRQINVWQPTTCGSTSPLSLGPLGMYADSLSSSCTLLQVSHSAVLLFSYFSLGFTSE